MKLFSALLFSIFVSGCSFLDRDQIVVDRPVPSFPEPSPATQTNYTWIVITRDNIEEVLNQLEASGQNPVLFAVTPEGYRAITLNSAELRRYIQQQNSIIAAYAEYIEENSNQ